MRKYVDKFKYLLETHKTCTKKNTNLHHCHCVSVCFSVCFSVCVAVNLIFLFGIGVVVFCVCVCKETKMEPSLLDIRIIRFGRHIHIVTKRNTMRLFCSLVSCVFLLLFLLFSSKLVGVLLSFFFLLTVASLCCSSFPAMF